MKKLILLDGMAAVYRGYYALGRNPRINSRGMNTSAILGFTMSLYDLIRSQHPTHMGVAFDLQKPTFRHEMYADYKAGRDAMPEEIQQGLPWIMDIIKAFRIPILTCEGFEADDVVGTLSHAAELAGFDQVVMVTPDKDFAQLVTDCVRMYRYGRGGRPDSIMGPADVCEQFGVTDCRQVIDLLGLWGDASDNIPGIAGVGEKTAKKLIAQFGSIEAMLAHTDEIKNDRLRNMVKEGGEQALFSKQLATIRLDAPIAFDEEALLMVEPDYDMLRQICDELEFRQFARRVFTDLSVTSPDVALRMQARQPASVASATADRRGHAPQPAEQLSIFGSPDSTDQSTASTESHRNHAAVAPAQLTDSVMADIRGQDIAVVIEGGQISIATDADSVWHGDINGIDVAALTALLADTDTTKICFNIKALLAALRALGVDDLRGNVADIQLAHYLIDAEARHTIDFVCRQALEFEPQDVAEQASALWQLYPLMASRLRDTGLVALYHDVELPLAAVLLDMEQTGVRIDIEALRAYSARLTAEMHDIEQRIFDIAGMQFNIGSPRQLGEVLYERLRVTDRPPRTATKQYSTAEEALTKLADSHPIIPLILEYRSLAKLIGTYLDPFPNLVAPADGRLHTIFTQTVTATGRLSSRDPNLQNIPIRTERGREIRRAFVPADADHLILAADYSQIELRIIAALSGDRHMLAAFAAGHDIHAATAAKIYHVDIEQVSRDQRRNAKSVNFGIVYGISAFGLSEQLSIPRKEAAALIDEYFTQYPDVAAFIERYKTFAHEHGYAQTLLGRRRYLPDINSRNAAARSFAERNAVNMPIQGTSADMIKLAMVAIHRELQQRKLHTKMILQVHDELVFDLCRDEEEEVRALVEHHMKTALPLDGIDIEVGIGVGANWLEAH